MLASSLQTKLVTARLTSQSNSIKSVSNIEHSNHHNIDTPLSEAVATLVDSDMQALRSPKILVNAAKTGTVIHMLSLHNGAQLLL